MSRLDNIDILGNPWNSLNELEKAAVEALARKDAEVSADLKFAKALSVFSTTDLIGEPPTSDSVFLVALREQLDKSRPKPFLQTWFGLRLWVSALSVSVLLFAGIYFGGEQAGTPSFLNFADESIVTDVPDSDLDWYEGLEELDELDELAFADYLDITEDINLWSFNIDSDEPYADQFLELDNQSMDDILQGIESLHFFENNEYADES